MNMHSDKKIFNKAGSVSKKEGQHGLAVSIKQLVVWVYSEPFETIYVSYIIILLHSDHW